jgi:succinate dehydrogenase / fumarate reductase flavoprotein subunit
MQGLADGYFIAPYTVADHLTTCHLPAVTTDHPAFKQTLADVEQRTNMLLAINGRRTSDSFHRELGKIIWNECGMSRSHQGLTKAISQIQALKEEFCQNVRVLGNAHEFNQDLERAGRVLDFIEFGELMCRDALAREESCGGHFREEYQDADGQADRNDERFCHVAAWEYTGERIDPNRHEEQLTFSDVPLMKRNYNDPV